MIKLVGAITGAKETTSTGDETDYSDVFPVPRGSNKSVCVCVMYKIGAFRPATLDVLI